MAYPTTYVPTSKTLPPSGGPRPGTRALYDSGLARWPRLRPLGIYNPRDVRGNPYSATSGWQATPSQHATGQAGDWGVPLSRPGVYDRALGDEVAAVLVARAADLGIMEVIWWERRWTAAGGWRPYAGLSPHHDHVHWAQHPDAAAKLTRAEADRALAGQQEEDDMYTDQDRSVAEARHDQLAKELTAQRGRLEALDAKVTALEEQAEALVTNGDAVDVRALAKAVADEVAARLRD